MDVASYLDLLNVDRSDMHKGKTVLDRVKELEALCVRMLGEAPEAIFIDNFRDVDGTIKIDDLTFFTDGFMFSCDDFRTSTDIVIDLTKNMICGCRFNTEEYDLMRDPSSNSEFFVEFVLRGAYVHLDQARWNFRARGMNCEYLRRILFDRVMPNMKMATR